MRFFSEMFSKYGFDSGNTIPEGIAVFRKVYITVMNKLLKKHKSNVRLLPFDRDLKNWCLILAVPYDEFKKLYPNEDDYSGYSEPTKEHETVKEVDQMDKAYEKALQEALEMGLDDYVIIEAKVSLDYQQFLMDLDRSLVGG